MQFLKKSIDHVFSRNSPTQVHLAALNDEAVRCVQRYWEYGHPADLDTALELMQELVAATPRDAPERPMYIDNLGTVFSERYKRSGQLADMTTAIAAHRLALASFPLAAPTRSGCLNNLGNGFRLYYLHSGRLAELDASIETLQQALQSASAHAPGYGLILNNLGTSLYYRYTHRELIDDLNAAITCFRQALSLAPTISLDRPLYLTNLGNALSERYARFRHMDDLNQAIALHIEALDALDPHSLSRALYLGNLGAAYLDRFAHVHRSADLQEARTVLQQALTMADTDSPERPVWLTNLGLCFDYACHLFGDSAACELGRVTYQQACKTGLDKAPTDALRSSRNWGNWALERHAWAEAAEAFSYGRRVIEQVLPIQLLRAGKEAWLREARKLSVGAAYAMAHQDDLITAVETLEQGRARLLGESLQQTRSDLERLALRGYRSLLERYQTLNEQYLGLTQPDAARTVPNWRSALEDNQSELQTCIAAIRQVTGYEDFFLPPAFDQIQHSFTEGGGVGVYVLVTSAGGLGLISHSDGVKEVWLDLIEDEVNTLLIKHEDELFTSGFLPAQLGDAPLDAQLNSVLPLLGERLMRPVAEALKSLGTSEVTLIPCGRLALFPLHAAEYQVNGQTRCFMHEFTVSYAPSARALDSCRNTLSAMPAQSRTLGGVGNPLPLPEDTSPLAYARLEVEGIAPLFGDATTVLCEQQATREALDTQLGQTTYLHLSCHGTFNAQDPLESGVVLSNGEMLTVRDLIGGQRLRGTRLVVLSACQTAITDFNHLPEEAIGLPGGFMQAGVPGVVGTLWSVNDLSTALLMIRFYEYHLNDGLHPAAALRKAQLWLRDVTNAELSELFAKYKLTATDRPASTRMAYEMASEKFREHTLRDPNEKPYAHPYYWAPFVFYGV